MPLKLQPCSFGRVLFLLQSVLFLLGFLFSGFFGILVGADMKKLKKFLLYCAAFAGGLALFGYASTGQSYRHPVPKNVTVTVPFSVR